MGLEEEAEEKRHEGQPVSYCPECGGEVCTRMWNNKGIRGARYCPTCERVYNLSELLDKPPINTSRREA